ncbi:MAG: hypothetical protein IJI12_02735, partial [Atopobiaceae bacterium]|nr:hypothetical protein [Atopobiaceae bacterium]
VREKTKESFTVISYCAWQKSGWVTAPYDYDPGVTVEQWRELLTDPEIMTANALITLKCLNEHPDGATCTELSEFYGRVKNFYNSNVTTLGEKVAKKLDLPVREGEDVSSSKYWHFVCLGSHVKPRRHGSFAWKLRDEVREALKSIDLSDIPLSEAEQL